MMNVIIYFTFTYYREAKFITVAGDVMINF